MKFHFMKHHRSLFSVWKMCAILNVSRSGFHKWLKRKKGKRALETEKLKNMIKDIFYKFKGRYGTPRITSELYDAGHKVSENRVARIMQSIGLSGKRKPKFRISTTDSNHSNPISPNLLNQNFHISKKNRVWMSDITYIKSSMSWLYLCVIIDLFSRKVVGFSLADHMRTEMVIDAFDRAVQDQKPEKGLIFHSDRGVQYTSQLFRRRLKKYEFISSMSRKGNCYDNAVMESFFGSLKTEEVHNREYEDILEARRSIFEYIEIFYNRRRKHSSLGYKSPMEFEKVCKAA